MKKERFLWLTVLGTVQRCAKGSALDTGQSLLKLYHFLSQLPVFLHPVFDPCPNLGNRRVADTAEIPAYLRVRKGRVLPRKIYSVPLVRGCRLNLFPRNLELIAQKVDNLIHIGCYRPEEPPMGYLLLLHILIIKPV